MTNGGAIGVTADVENFSSQPLAVTVTQIVDPASGATQFDTPNPGDRFVAVELTVESVANATVSDDANNDVTVIGTDSQAYTADFDSVSECTNFSFGEYTLLSGNSENGCVVFQLPTGVDVKDVQFVFGGNNVDIAQWHT